jgi:nitrogen regulatory protein P-II 1
MRLVLAVIEPARLRAVKDALAGVDVGRMTVCDALDERAERGAKTQPRLLRQAVLEIAVNEDFLDRTVEAIARVTCGGDGAVYILPLDEVVRLSDAVRGAEAVS